MTRIPFFGDDDDDDSDENSTDLEHTEQVGDLTIASNSDITVHRPFEDGGDEEGWLSQGPRVHTISMSGRTDASSDQATTPSSSSSSVEPADSSDTDLSGSSTESLTDTPGRTSGQFPSGMFVLPRNKHFFQKLEARGRNGHGEFVETVYVLIGPTPTYPTDLVRLEQPELYGDATRKSVEFSPEKMARQVAKLYPDGQVPGVIARFHTHPPDGSITPSSADRQSAPSVRRAFVNAFGTDNFEYFHGIHQLEPHGMSPSPAARQAPEVEQQRVRLGETEADQEYITWLGEQYQHRLAVFGRGFASLEDVGLRGDQQ